MIKNKEVFVKKLALVRQKLPKRYGTVAKILYPHISLSQVHNVVNLGTVNWEILKVLNEVANFAEKAKSKQNEKDNYETNII